MQKITLQSITSAHRGAFVTLGNFDGVHLGHQAMIQTIVTLAKAQGCPSMVIVFEPQPQEYFSAHPPARLTHFDEKCAIFETLGVDYVLCLDFNAELARMSAEAFIQAILVEGLGIKHVLVGDDFKFGENRRGDLALLQRLGPVHGFTSEGLESIMVGVDRVSSTRIREALKAGQFAQAASWLGRPYRMSGRVERGDQRGRLLGYPTANINPGRLILPFSGVYAVKVYGLGSVPLVGMANLGTRPTVDGKKTLLEVHIFQFDQTIYGQALEIEFCHKIREEQRFESLADLTAQIQADHLAVESYFHHG
jgi:riboflavin kinase / FMN adenylyltransferase